MMLPHNLDHHTEDTILCRQPEITVAVYREMVKKRKKEEIVEFVRNRFTERYITPLEATPAIKKNGFCTMAICCLMIEALECFWKGWPETPYKKGAQAFGSFFSRSNNLKDFQGYAKDFYEHVRCGILHQAETTGGWRITRHKDAPLFDSNTKTVNATKFHGQLKQCLDNYCKTLEREEWDSDVWNNFIKKMKSICQNC